MAHMIFFQHQTKIIPQTPFVHAFSSLISDVVGGVSNNKFQGDFLFLLEIRVAFKESVST